MSPTCICVNTLPEAVASAVSLNANVLPADANAAYADMTVALQRIKTPVKESMKCVLLTMCLLLASAPVYGEWEMIGVSETYKANVYVDYATVRRTGNILTMWELFDYETNQTLAGKKLYVSHTTEREYDCGTELTRVLVVKWFADHMGTGKMVDSLNLTSNWTVVERGSIAETLWIAACRLLKEQR
jgi:hypothetical protein